MLGRGLAAIASVFLLFAMPIYPIAPSTQATPADEWVEISLEMSTYHLNVVMEPNEDSSATVEGWVNLLKKRPGEVVSVTLTIDGDSNLWGFPDPASFVFQEMGTKYFNLTVTVREDTPESPPLHLTVGAHASSRTASDVFQVEMVVYPLHVILRGEAELVDPPGEVEPGGYTTGLVEIFNEGSRPTTYSLVLLADPDGVVDEVGFFEDPELGNNYLKKREFQVVARSGAEVGSHFVEIGLMAYQDPQDTVVVDTFSFQLKVVEPEARFSWGSALVVGVAVLGLVAVAVVLWRRRR